MNLTYKWFVYFFALTVFTIVFSSVNRKMEIQLFDPEPSILLSRTLDRITISIKEAFH